MKRKNFANSNNLLIGLGPWPAFKNFNQAFSEIEGEFGFPNDF